MLRVLHLFQEQDEFVSDDVAACPEGHLSVKLSVVIILKLRLRIDNLTCIVIVSKT